MLDNYDNFERWNTGGQFDKTGSNFLPQLASAKNVDKHDLGSQSFKKNHSVVHSKFLSPTAASGLTSPLGLIHGLAGEMFKNKSGQTEEANLNSNLNPFKFKRNT